MPDLNVKNVRAFVAVVRERSTTKAAHRCGISRAGIVSRLQSLERTLDMKLLERSFPPNKAETGRTQLTAEGMALLPKAVELLRAHDALFGAPTGSDPREMDRILAVGLLELAVTALRQDLSDADRIRIHEILLD